MKFRFAAVAFAALVALPATASAYAEKKVGQVGSFKILKITENGKTVDRCTAHIDGPSGALRLAFHREKREHAISWPGVKGAPKGTAEILLDRQPPILITPGLVDVRVASALDYPTVDRIMKTKLAIGVKFNNKTMNWAIGNTNMEGVYRTLTNCISSTY